MRKNNMSIPTDLMLEAQEIDMMDNEIASEMILPEGKFSKGALNRLVKELNVVLGLFQDSYPEFEEDITIFPEEFVVKLQMVGSAAADAGVDFDFNPAEIEDDRDLAILSGRLKKLGKEKTFKKFLEDNTLIPEEEVVEETVVQEEPTPTTDVEAIFARRM